MPDENAEQAEDETPEENPSENEDPSQVEDPGEGEPPVVVPAGDPSLLINGQPAPLELNKEMQKGTTYVSLSVMARQLAPNSAGTAPPPRW